MIKIETNFCYFKFKITWLDRNRVFNIVVSFKATLKAPLQISPPPPISAGNLKRETYTPWILNIDYTKLTMCQILRELDRSCNRYRSIKHSQYKYKILKMLFLDSANFKMSFECCPQLEFVI